MMKTSRNSNVVGMLDAKAFGTGLDSMRLSGLIPMALTHWRNLKAALGVLISLLLLLFGTASPVHAAPSACTAMWGLRANTLTYWNPSVPGWTSVSVFPTGYTAPNALAGRDSDGALYFAAAVASSATNTMTKATFSNSTGTITFSQTGIIQTLTSVFPTYTDTTGVSRSHTPTGLNYVGATFDRTQNQFFIYATSTAANAVSTTSGISTTTLGLIGLMNPDSPTAVSWQIIREQPAGTTTTYYPSLATSGDIFADQSTGQIWIITNTANPNNRLLKLDLSVSGSTLVSATVTGTATFASLTGSAAGIAVDPVSGSVFMSTANGGDTHRLTDHTALSIATTLNQTGSGVQDIGNCVTQPDPPTIVKSTNPVASTATTLGTGTLTITINNPNKVPIFLTKAVTDTFPVQFGLPLTGASQFLTVTCASDGVALASRPALTTLTAVSTTTLVIPSGALIPGGATSGGSCSFSARFSTTFANLYTNTIPAGSLTTTAGSSTTAATATYMLRATDFTITKTQQLGSGTASLTSGTITLPASQTYTYQLQVVNSASGVTATATFTDTLPALLTPLLTVTAIATGGGSCGASTATVAGPPNRMQILGTATATPPGSTCTVLIYGKSTTTIAASTSINNTTGLTTTTVIDAVSSNNKATVTTTLSPSTLITITKTNQVTALVSGQTTSYTITVANLGPAAAGGGTFLDPPVTGLNCTTVTFTSTPAGSITISPVTPTLNALQTTGFVLNPFPANSSATFNVTCSVTATGL